MSRRVFGGAVLALAALWLATSPALAHERRQVGPYTFVVGFLVEPAYTDQVNGVDLRITETAGNKPVEGAQDTLEVEVTAAGQTKRFRLASRFGQPGAYAAHFVPSRTGSYVFRFVGRVGSQQVDERFESGPGRFNEPEDFDAARFPAGADTAGELRAALDQTRLIALAALAVGVALPTALAFWRRR